MMRDFTDSSRKIAEIAWLYLVHASWQSALVGIVVLTLVLVGRRWPAPLRYALLTVALVKFLIPPFLAISCGLFSWLGPRVVPPRSDTLLIQTQLPTTPSAAPSVAEIDQNPRVSDGQADSTEEKTSKSGDLAALPEIHAQKAPSDTAPRLPAAVSSEHAITPAASQLSSSAGHPRPVLTAERGRTTALLAWCLGAGLVILWLVDQQRRLNQILRHAPPSTEKALCRRLENLAQALGLRRPPALRRSKSASVPFACGLVRRTIVLPDDLINELSAEQLDVVLAHELAHHRRGDLWVNALQTTAFVAFWFHPVYWWLTRAMRQVREECCDDLLLAHGLMSGDVCCETLLAVARRRAQPRQPSMGISMAHPLGPRLKRLLDDSHQPKSRLSVGGWIVIIAIAVLVLPGVRRITESMALAASDKQVAPAATAEARTEVSGTVTGEGGIPVGGADVFVIRRNPFSRDLDNQTTLVRQGQTDAKGHYHFSVELKDLTGPVRWGFEVWAVKADHSVGVANASLDRPRAALDISLPRSIAEFSLIGPDGRPVAGATVWPEFVGSDAESGTIPIELRARLRRQTDAKGHVSLPVDGRKNVHSLTIEAAVFGTQSVWFEGRRTFGTPPEVVTLGAVGKVVGRIVSDEPTAAANLEVRISTRPAEGEPQNCKRYGLFTTRTNEQGQFEVPAIRAGVMNVNVRESERFSLLAVPTRDVLVASGQLTTIEVPLRKATRVSGRALDRNTNRPVPGVVVAWNKEAGEVSVVTNANGEYSFLTFPGSMSLRIFPPLPYVPLADFQRVTIRNAESARLPDLPLTKGYSLTGKTIEADGKPKSQIQLEATWTEEESAETPWGQKHTRVGQRAMLDDDGNFSIPGVPPNRELQLTASRRGVEVAPPLTLDSPPGAHLKVTVRALDMVYLSGTVVDSRRHPIANAVAQIEMSSDAGPNMKEVGVVDKATTDAQGRFRSTKMFDRQGLYRAQVLVGDKKIAATDWITPATTSTNAFPVLVAGEQTSPPNGRPQIESRQLANPPRELPHMETATLEGAIVDSVGSGVPNATVVIWSMAQRTQQKATDQGRFSRANLPKEGAFLFVDAKGFRFHGQWVQPGPSVRIPLIRRSEPAVPMRPLVDRPTSKEILDRAWRAFQPTRDQLLELFAAQGTLMGKSYNTFAFSDQNFAELYAQFDPPRALEFFGSQHFKSKWLGDRVREQVAEHLTATDPDGALRQIEQMHDPHRALAELAVNSPTLSSVRRHKMLDQLRAEKASGPGTSGIESLLFLARCYRRIGDSKTAAELLATVENQLTTATAGQRRGSFVRACYAIEKASLEGIDTTGLLGPAQNELEYNRYRGAIARAIAARNPEAAERISESLRGDPGLWTAKICQEMAMADPSRAERLAKTSPEPVYRAYALGCVAVAVARKDRATARRLIEEAYEILQQCVDTGNRGSRVVQKPTGIAFGLLELVEQIDPTLIREFFWRAISLRSSTTFGNVSMSLGPYGDGGRMRLSDPVLAAFLARYDLETARHVLRPPGDESVAEGVDEYPASYFFAAAILDPVGTIDTVARLPHASRSQRVTSERAWRELFASLTHRGEERVAWLREKQLFLWKVGSDDF